VFLLQANCNQTGADLTATARKIFFIKAANAFLRPFQSFVPDELGQGKINGALRQFNRRDK
jgi:hypothetical protein